MPFGKVSTGSEGVNRFLAELSCEPGLLIHRYVAKHEVLRGHYARDRRIRILKRLVSLQQPGPMALAHRTTFVAHGLPKRVPLAGAVDELDLALAFGIFVRVEDPDVRCDSGAVEHARGQRDDR